MRFFLIAAVFALSLVYAASAPRAAAKPYALRQATRQQIVRHAANKGMRKRQSLPSNGVYPTCDGSPTTGSTVYAVVQNVELTLPPDTLPIDSVNVESAPDCTRVCIAYGGSPSCAGSQYTVSSDPLAINCDLYEVYSGADNNDDATSTYRGFDCSGIQQAFGVGDLTCCNYYA